MSRLALSWLLIIVLFNAANAQQQDNDPPEQTSLVMDSILKQGPEYELIKPMVGTWMVRQTIFLKESEKVMVRDTFRVERKMVGNFLQEIMEPAGEDATNSFKRISYLNYNRTNLRWEYIVLDTRYPLMMFETSIEHQVSGEKAIHLYLDNFIVPPFWGPEFAGMLGKQHRVFILGPDQNISRQFWTLPGGKEFLAIEYVYRRVAENED